MGRNVAWGEMSRGETSQGEMSRGETSFGEKRRIAVVAVLQCEFAFRVRLAGILGLFLSIKHLIW